MPWAELKKWPPTQDGEAAFPIDLHGEFSDLRSELEKIEDELRRVERRQDSKGRDLCFKYYQFRFQRHFHSFGYGAYCTWWAIEGWYDEPTEQ